MNPHRREANAFTLVELLVVILIIAVLIGILVPVVSRVRLAARTASSQATITQISNAINVYFGDFKAYPGPLTNTEVWNSESVFPPIPSPFSGFEIENIPASEGWDTSQSESDFRQKVTMSENLVLGLMGGLKVKQNGALVYDPRLVGGGANALTTNAAAAKRYKPYLENPPLSWRTGSTGKTGHFKDDAGEADDTIIPEFVDAYNDPLPILYLRAKRGAPPSNLSETGSPIATEEQNNIITYDGAQPSNRWGQYDLHQILGYTEPLPAIGVGRKNIKYYNGSPNPVTINDPRQRYHGLSLHGHNAGPYPQATLGPPSNNYFYPYNAYPYFRSKSLSTTQTPVAQNKDGFILICAGPDRIYGTEDDITNFGEVGK